MMERRKGNPRVRRYRSLGIRLAKPTAGDMERDAEANVEERSETVVDLLDKADFVANGYVGIRGRQIPADLEDEITAKIAAFSREAHRAGHSQERINTGVDSLIDDFLAAKRIDPMALKVAQPSQPPEPEKVMQPPEPEKVAEVAQPLESEKVAEVAQPPEPEKVAQPLQPIESEKVCNVSICKKPHKAKGLCHTCYHRSYRRNRKHLENRMDAIESKLDLVLKHLAKEDRK